MFPCREDIRGSRVICFDFKDIIKGGFMKKMLALIFLYSSVYAQVLYRDISADDNIVTNEVDPQSHIHSTNTVIHVTGGDKDNWNAKASTNYVDLAIAGIPASDSTRIISATSNLFVSISSDSNLLMYGIANNITNPVKTFAQTQDLSSYVSSPYDITNKVVSIWRGTYSQYLALTTKYDSTTYIIEDEPVFDTIGIYQDFYSYNVVADGTTTVVLVQEKTVYNVNVTTNTTLAFDSSSLNFTNKIATFELHMNMANTNASVTWGLNTNQLYWVSNEPTFDQLSTYYIVMRMFSATNVHANVQYNH